MYRINRFTIILLYSLITIISSYKLYHSNYNYKLKNNNKLLLSTNNEVNEKTNINNNLLSTLSLAGVIESSYLTWSKITSSDVSGLCSDSNSCNNVLTSPYSEIPFIHLPLSLLAVVAYGLVFLSSLNPNNLSKNMILLLTTSLATFSGYLMILLNQVIQLSCNYCYLSAFLSISLAIIAFNSNLISNKTKAFVMSGVSATLTILFSSFLYYTTGLMINNNVVQASTAPAAQYLESIDKNVGYLPPEIKTTSSDEAIQLSNRLNKLNAKFYGAFWCSHCFNQKQILGKEAMGKVEYIECDKKGFNSQNSLCKEKKVPGYPTWEINGELIPGERSLDELKEIVTYIEKKDLLSLK